MGCLDVQTSMKVLDFDTRSAIAKECINRLCEAVTATNGASKRKTDARMDAILSDTPCLDNAGTNVQLTITSLWLKMSDLNSGNVSFLTQKLLMTGIYFDRELKNIPVRFYRRSQYYRSTLENMYVVKHYS